MAGQRVCVLGSSGFVGSHLVRRLRSQPVELITPEKGADLRGQDLGLVYYCAGLTADFRTRPFDTVEAHVLLLNTVLRFCRFEGLVYLSSTRVYTGAQVAQEEADLVVNPNQANDLYNLSKLLGESLCLASGRPEVRVARLSNVVGPGMPAENFLASLLIDAARGQTVTLRTALTSAKDYTVIDDVVDLLLAIGERGRARIYNVASGQNTTHQELVTLIRQHTQCQFLVVPNAPEFTFAPIDIRRVQGEFGFQPRPLEPVLIEMIQSIRAQETLQ